MRDGTVLQRDPNQAVHRELLRLIDSLRHFVRLAIAKSDLPAAIARHDQGREAEPPASLDHRRTAFDFHCAIVEIAAT
jgi:hypothetical protein